jgi:hypothetical protein
MSLFFIYINHKRLPITDSLLLYQTNKQTNNIFLVNARKLNPLHHMPTKKYLYSLYNKGTKFISNFQINLKLF